MQEKQSEMLRDAGSGELEIMVFTIGGQLFGIDVAEVQEIMRVAPLVSIQKANEYIEGIFKPRDQVITVINLPSFLDLAASDQPQRDIFIITAFQNSEYAFHVHTVVGIDRISCSQMKKPDRVIFAGKESIATGIVEHGEKLITVLDFASVITTICAGKELEEAPALELVHA